MKTEPDDPLPPYSYVPGGPWPHPIGSPAGHMAGERGGAIPPIEGNDWEQSSDYRWGIRLFNEGFYWEAHEAWEGLWHAHGRRGPTADVLKALIKLAAAGVKVRERQPRGVTSHARRAAALLRAVKDIAGPQCLGIDLEALADQADRIAEVPPEDPSPAGTPVTRVFPFRIEPK